MAITQGDGSIILDTKVNTSGIKKGIDEANKFAEMSVNRQRSVAMSLSKIYMKQGQTQIEAQKNAWKNLKNNTVAVEDYKKAVADADKKTKKFGKSAKDSSKTAKNAFEQMGKAAKKLAAQLGLAYSVSKFMQFSKEAGQLATQVEASTMRLADIYGKSSEAVGDFIDDNARALGMSKASATSFASVYGNLFSVWADQATNAQLTNKYLNLTAVLASKTGRTVEDVQERIRSGLLGNTEAIEDLGVFVNVKTIEITDAFKRIADGRSWEQLNAYEQSEVRTMAILEQSVKKYGDQVQETTALTRSSYQASYEDMKATWGRFVNVVLMPILEVVTEIMDKITLAMQVIGGFSDKTVTATATNSAEMSNNISDAVDSQKDLTDEVNNTAKAQEKYLAGFDKVQKVGGSSGTGGGSSSTGGGSGKGNTLAKTFNVKTEGGGSNELEAQGKKIATALGNIMKIAGGALLAIGLVLLVTGHPLWGIKFIIAGALLFVGGKAVIGKTDAGDKVSTLIGDIMLIIAPALIAIGAILCVLGQVAWGVGFIIAGAFVFAVASVTIFEGAMSEKVKTVIETIMGIGAALALTLGLIMVVTGHITPISIGLLIVGAGLLASEVALMWDKIPNKTKGFISVMMGILGGALLVLGILLLFSGAGIPLGLGLILAGAGSLATAIIPNWDLIGGFIKKVLDGIVGTWKKAVNNVIEFFGWLTDGWEAIGDTLINALKGVANFFIDIFNGLIKGINGAIKTINKIPGVELKTLNKIPHLAQGAVIPPNKEFLAVLGDQKSGTNVEAPLSTIKQAVAEVLAGANMGGNGAETIELVVNLDGAAIYKSVVNRNKQNTIRTGKNALAY